MSSISDTIEGNEDGVSSSSSALVPGLLESQSDGAETEQHEYHVQALLETNAADDDQALLEANAEDDDTKEEEKADKSRKLLCGQEEADKSCERGERPTGKYLKRVKVLQAFTSDDNALEEAEETAARRTASSNKGFVRQKSPVAGIWSDRAARYTALHERDANIAVAVSENGDDRVHKLLVTGTEKFTPSEANWANVPFLFRSGIASAHQRLTEVEAVTLELRTETSGLRQHQVHAVSRMNKNKDVLDVTRTLVGKMFVALGDLGSRLHLRKKRKDGAHVLNLSQTDSLMLTEMAAGEMSNLISGKISRPTSAVSMGVRASKSLLTGSSVSAAPGYTSPRSPQRMTVGGRLTQQSPASVGKSPGRSPTQDSIASIPDVPEDDGSDSGDGSSGGSRCSSVSACSSRSPEKAKLIGMSVEDKARIEDCVSSVQQLGSMSSLQQATLQKLEERVSEAQEQMRCVSSEMMGVRSRLDGEFSAAYFERATREITWQAMLEYLPKWLHFLGATDDDSMEAASKLFQKCREAFVVSRHLVCLCGNIFKDDAMFCRKCGADRPEQGEVQQGYHHDELGQKLRRPHLSPSKSLQIDRDYQFLPSSSRRSPRRSPSQDIGAKSDCEGATVQGSRSEGAKMRKSLESLEKVSENLSGDESLENLSGGESGRWRSMLETGKASSSFEDQPLSATSAFESKIQEVAAVRVPERIATGESIQLSCSEQTSEPDWESDASTQRQSKRINTAVSDDCMLKIPEEDTAVLDDDSMQVLPNAFSVATPEEDTAVLEETPEEDPAVLEEDARQTWNIICQNFEVDQKYQDSEAQGEPSATRDEAHNNPEAAQHRLAEMRGWSIAATVQGTHKVCYCGNQFHKDAVFCRKCGEIRPKPQRATRKVCLCGSTFADDAMFCRRCGSERPQHGEVSSSESSESLEGEKGDKKHRKRKKHKKHKKRQKHREGEGPEMQNTACQDDAAANAGHSSSLLSKSKLSSVEEDSGLESDSDSDSGSGSSSSGSNGASRATFEQKLVSRQRIEMVAQELQKMNEAVDANSRRVSMLEAAQESAGQRMKTNYELAEQGVALAFAEAEKQVSEKTDALSKGMEELSSSFQKQISESDAFHAAARQEIKSIAGQVEGRIQSQLDSFCNDMRHSLEVQESRGNEMTEEMSKLTMRETNFAEQLHVIFPRALAMKENGKDVSDLPINEARIFALDVRLDAMEEKLRLGWQEAVKEMRVGAIRGTAPSRVHRLKEGAAPCPDPTPTPAPPCDEETLPKLLAVDGAASRPKERSQGDAQSTTRQAAPKPRPSSSSIQTLARWAIASRSPSPKNRTSESGHTMGLDSGLAGITMGTTMFPVSIPDGHDQAILAFKAGLKKNQNLPKSVAVEQSNAQERQPQRTNQRSLIDTTQDESRVEAMTQEAVAFDTQDIGKHFPLVARRLFEKGAQKEAPSKAPGSELGIGSGGVGAKSPTSAPTSPQPPRTRGEHPLSRRILKHQVVDDTAKPIPSAGRFLQQVLDLSAAG